MDSPQCLIEVSKDGKMTVRPETLQIVKEINKRIVIVGIAGIYRTGKSYLMNRLAGRGPGFSVSPGVECNTRGIWMWCLPHPKKSDCVLLLLDTEGLQAVKQKAQVSSKIFSMVVLLSSTLIYNNLGVINRHLLLDLQLITELTNLIQVKTKTIEEKCKNYGSFFPDLIWVLRDFTNVLEIKRQKCTAVQYLDYVLDSLSSDDEDTEPENTAKTFIMESFPNRNCFVFVHPTTSELIANCSSLEDSAMNAQFVEQSKAFCQHIYETSKAKCICGEEIRNGEVLASFIHLYINYINSGDIPLYKDVVQTLSATVNTEVAEKTLNDYKQQMKIQTKSVIETEQELEEIHKQNMNRAVKAFRKGCFRDCGEAETKLKHAINEWYQECCKTNEELSCRLCETSLGILFKDIEDHFRSKYYETQDGYQLYLQDRDRAVQRYNETKGLGIMKQKSMESQMEKENDREACILKEAVKMNENAKCKAEAYFITGMKMVQFPTDTVLVLDDAYQKCKEKSFEIFKTHSSNCLINEYEQAIKREFLQYYTELQIRNKQESDERCEKACRRCFIEIEDKFQSKSYCVPGGYKAYLHDCDTAIMKYKQTPMLGISKQSTLEVQLKKESKRKLQIYQEEENAKALSSAKELYRTKTCNVVRQCRAAKELKDIHNKYTKEAIDLFRKLCFLDEENNFQRMLQNYIQEEYRHIFIKNIDISYKRCKTAWAESVMIIEEKCRNNTYRCFHGFEQYENDLKMAIEFYQSKETLGLKKHSFFLFSMKKEKQRGELVLKMEEDGTKEEIAYLTDELQNNINEYSTALDTFSGVLEKNSSECIKIANDLDEYHKGSTTASISGNVISAAGGITTVVGVCLAPVTLGASLIVSAVGVSVAAVGGTTSAVAKTADYIKKKTLCKEFQSMMQEITLKEKDCMQKAEDIVSVGDRLVYLKSLMEKDNTYLPDASSLNLSPNAEYQYSRLTGLLGSARAISVGLASLSRIAHVATGILSGLFLILDAVFIAQDAKDLHRGAKTDVAEEMRKAVASFNEYRDNLYAFTLSCKEFHKQLLNIKE